MNRVDRLFAILLLLQRKRHIRALDLAQTFEVSERTIYRDMEALSETGVPVLGTPGEGYELMQGYFLPPLLFTTSEATAMFLGAKMMMAFTQGKVASDAEQALGKIAVILPDNVRTEVQRLSEIVGFYPAGPRFDLYETHLATLQQAIRERRVVRICYHSFSQDETTERDFEPHRLYFMGSQWYVVGYCKLRHDFRDFRLNRIESLRLTTETFELKLRSNESKPIVCPPLILRVRMMGNVVRWVRERQHYACRGEEAVPGSDDVDMIYHVDKLNEFLPWLLSWGASATPLDPPELRDAMRSELSAMIERLS